MILSIINHKRAETHINFNNEDIEKLLKAIEKALKADNQLNEIILKKEVYNEELN